MTPTSFGRSGARYGICHWHIRSISSAGYHPKKKAPTKVETLFLVTQVDQMWNSIVEGAVRIDQAVEDLVINEQ